MANKNGMGPDEKGPRTGRGLGLCGKIRKRILKPKKGVKRSRNKR